MGGGTGGAVKGALQQSCWIPTTVTNKGCEICPVSRLYGLYKVLQLQHAPHWRQKRRGHRQASGLGRISVKPRLLC